MGFSISPTSLIIFITSGLAQTLKISSSSSSVEWERKASLNALALDCDFLILSIFLSILDKLVASNLFFLIKSIKSSIIISI